jgi:hypothetical protein
MTRSPGQVADDAQAEALRPDSAELRRMLTDQQNACAMCFDTDSLGFGKQLFRRRFSKTPPIARWFAALVRPPDSR